LAALDEATLRARGHGRVLDCGHQVAEPIVAERSRRGRHRPVGAGQPGRDDQHLGPLVAETIG